MSIQIGTNWSVQQHEIVLFCKPYKSDFQYVRLIDAVLLLD